MKMAQDLGVRWMRGWLEFGERLISNVLVMPRGSRVSHLPKRTPAFASMAAIDTNTQLQSQ